MVLCPGKSLQKRNVRNAADKGINYAAVMSSVDMWRINPTTEKQKQIRKDQELQKE